MKYVSPSVRETAFNCPHCYAFAKQDWYSLHADWRPDDKPLTILDVTGLPALAHVREHGSTYRLYRVSISVCFRCKKIAIWVYDKLIYPQRGEAPPANPDLPDDIRRDYDEASSILDLSPRGSAALIRLAIQKLCIECGKSGKNLNKDIGDLVADGLDPHIQKALDTVRVIGNNAVHPGQIDLRDDRATAETLFLLLNWIAEKMISVPKHAGEIYASLPEDERKAIEKRDADS